MANYLKMPKKSQVLALLELGWSYRRIEAETGVRRETASRYDQMRRANAAKPFSGSDRPPPAESADLRDAEGSNSAKTFAGSDANPAKPFPGSTPRSRFTAAVYQTAIAEKLDAEPAAHLAGPGRGVRLSDEQPRDNKGSAGNPFGGFHSGRKCMLAGRRSAQKVKRSSAPSFSWADAPTMRGP